MEQKLNHQEISGNSTKVIADIENEKGLKTLYEEKMFQQFISMEKSELSELLWHG